MLCDFGLTLNQAKVYLAIVQLGVAPVSRVSKIAEVRREDTYRLLPTLEEIGLTEKIAGQPVKVRAKPLDDALSLLIQREQDFADRRISGLLAKKEEVLKYYRSSARRLTPIEGERTQFELLSRNDAVLGKVTGMINGAEKEIDVITSGKEFLQSFPAFTDLFKSAVKKGVKIRIILELHEQETSLPDQVRAQMPTQTSIDIKYRQHPASHYFIVDFKQTMIATSPDPPIGGHLYLWTSDSEFASTMLQNFEDVWQNS